MMVDKQLGDKVETVYVENVNEDASAIPVIRDLAQQGCKLIFTTSYGYMDQTIQVAGEFPDVKFEHCTGFKRADNVVDLQLQVPRRPRRARHHRRHDEQVRHAGLSRLLQGARSRAGRELLRPVGAEAEPGRHGQARA